MTAAEHDRAVAVTSHLPHAAAAALAAMLPEPCFRLAGSGFLGTSRLAAGDPEQWKQTFVLNRDNVAAALARYQQQLAALRTAILDGDETALENLLTLAKKNRDALGS